MTHLETRHLQLILREVRLRTPLPAASPACELKQQLILELMLVELRWEPRETVKCQPLDIAHRCTAQRQLDFFNTKSTG